uniref:Kynureninase-like n=2 Tax=Ciona intestinalis TaxID=7719 RepID=H2XXH7_CIOIN
MNGICTNGQRPRDILTKLAAEHGLKPLDDKFHEILDGKDPLSHLRKEFCIPKVSINIDEQDRESCLDFCSHSLGLQPKRTKEFVNKVLTEWADRGSMTYRYPDVINIFSDVSLAKGVAELVGAYSDEVALMNTLTVNLNLLLTSFYSPTKSRNKILLEGSTFPTNYFSCASHIKQRGFNVKDSLLLLEPRKGELILHTSDILDVINDEGESIALVLLSGVQYLTGQLLDMKTITDVAHAKGCMVGFDLAQAIGSV